MKKILVMMVFVVGMMLSGVGEAKAYIFTDNLSIGSCTITFELDVNCNNLTTPPVFTIRGFTRGANCAGIPSVDLRDAILEKLRDVEYIKYFLCPESDDAPPCTSGEFKEFKVKSPVCWRKQNIGTLENPIFRYIGFDCSNTKCVREWKVCWDPNLGYIYELKDYYLIYENDICNDIPEPYYEMGHNESTECFRMPTICDN